MRLLRDPPPDRPIALDDDLLVQADNARVLALLPPGAFTLVYIDPPFNTGTRRRLVSVRAVADEGSARRGFGGRRYRTEPVAAHAYDDRFDDYTGFLAPRLEAARSLLSERGTLYVHVDPRESHRVRVVLDAIFGPECFLNEIVWAYDYGGRARRRWPAKHDTILVYVRDPGRYHFDAAAVEREPYMAPGLVTPEKAARGKLPTDVWWHTIVPTRGPERTGYPTQKPEGVLRRIVAASSAPGDWCLDFFAGSGTLGAVAAALGRRFVLVDDNPEAIEIAAARLRALVSGSGGTGALKPRAAAADEMAG